MRIVIKPMGVIIVAASLLGLMALYIRAMDKPRGKQVAVTGSKVLTVSLHPDVPDRWVFASSASDSGSMTVTTSPDGPVKGQAIGKITIRKADPKKPERVQSFCILTRTYANYEDLRVGFWARASKARSCRVVFEQNGVPYDKDMLKNVSITPEWQAYTCYFKTSRDYAPKQARLAFQVGDTPGEFEFTGVVIDSPGRPK